MRIYSAFLRVLVHVIGVLIVVGSTLTGFNSGIGGGYGSGSVAGAVAGFISGAIVAGLLLGVIALLFEIRDALVAIRDRGGAV